ncbi:SusC/RagA family TonB-linked outer membrane protein [Aquimarina sp. MMG016]|uniref:SusC/RagA family TonB-linked outer membrane protein n=1 Tax=Aquimarina sp. MMG016 TaxID=2822690 RepID=UPI001B3A5456|nr:SusC/RagA family TonB-linked outer membrane protein [Aquimarina sp. MMG016]MBQ4819591.1 SusC/RagA family TonB-linked outer membrane protein [Aquimarina sp. MMG016]
MRTKQKLLMCFITIVSLGINAQSTISGIITEKSTGSAIPGANVIVRGTTTGAVSDFNGVYTIPANTGDVLVFSYLGFKDAEIVVNTTTIDVALEEDADTLDEVVVIGYGTTTVKDATGAIEKVDAKDFNQGAISSPEQLITGKTAGVNVIPPGGQPGQAGTISIRGGNSSLSANNSPLVVIDGVPIDQGTTGGNGVAALNAINPNDIESFVVLKDASSTAIYGSRASAGVILITTKSGSLSAPFKVQVNTTGSIGMVQRRTDVLNADEYRQVATNSQNAGLILPLLGNSNTDWQDEIFQEAIGTDTNITLTQGFGSTSYRVSAGYTTQDGLVKTSRFERSSAAISLRQNLFDRSLSIDLNIRGALTQDDFANGGALGAAAQFDPTQSVFSGSDQFGGYWEWLQSNGNPEPLAPRNPVGLLQQLTNTAETERALGNIKLDYNAPFLEGLNANINLGFDYNEVSGETNVPATSASGFLAQGTIGDYGSIRRSTLADLFLNYKKDIESIKSAIELTAGHTFQKFYRKNYNSTTPTVGAPTENSFATQNALESYVTRLRYSYDSRYLLTLSYRSDGSSRFSEENRWGNFFAAALAWNIAEEGFLQNSETISNLKLRLGYGQTGQQEIGVDFGYLPVYVNGADNQQYQLGNTFYNTVRPQGYDENIKWEESETYNIGLDYGFLDNRISGSIEYFTRETSDVLNLIPIPSGTNLTNQLTTNIGDLENSGFEFTIASDIIRKRNFNWNVAFNASYLTNEIVKLNIVDDPSFIGVPTGFISGGIGNTVQIHRVGSPQRSFLLYKQVYDAGGRPVEGVYEDINGDGIVDTGDLYISENPAADYLFGLSSSANYKNWDLNFTMRASIGNYVYNNVASSTGNEFGLHSLGTNRNVHASILETGFKNNQLLSDYYLEDASFLKMDNITLGYNFKDLINDDKIGLRMQLTVQNVFTITGYDGIDPEIPGGIDNNFFPRPRNIVFGANMNF